jgi:hypothetical protein
LGTSPDGASDAQAEVVGDPCTFAVASSGARETMTTLDNRPNTALLVVDVQNAAVERAHERDAVVANVGSLVEKARRAGVPVVWVQHSDEQLAKETEAWQTSERSPTTPSRWSKRATAILLRTPPLRPCCPASVSAG